MLDTSDSAEPLQDQCICESCLNSNSLSSKEYNTGTNIGHCHFIMNDNDDEESQEEELDEIVVLSQSETERSMAIGRTKSKIMVFRANICDIATEKLYELVNVLPREVKEVCNNIVSTQKIMVSDTRNIVARVDGFQLFLSEWGKEMKRFEADLSSISALEDWIRISTSEISQLKNQALFLNQCIDSSSEHG